MKAEMNDEYEQFITELENEVCPERKAEIYKKYGAVLIEVNPVFVDGDMRAKVRDERINEVLK